MPSAFDVTAGSPQLAAQRDSKSFQSIFPIGTGGLPVNGVGTGPDSGGTGFLPIATGSINSIPSGVPLYLRSAPGSRLLKVMGSTGKYLFTFAPAPNGTVQAWAEISPLNTISDIGCVSRHIASGAVLLQCYNASGAAADPAAGDAISVDFMAFTSGDPQGP